MGFFRAEGVTAWALSFLGLALCRHFGIQLHLF